MADEEPSKCCANLSDGELRLLMLSLQKKDDCYELSHLSRLARYPYSRIGRRKREHILGCKRCGEVYGGLRRRNIVAKLPGEFEVELGRLRLNYTDDRVALHGIIGLENLKHQTIASPDNWIQGYLHLRTSLTIDLNLGIYTFSVLDCPEQIARVSLYTPIGWEDLERKCDEAEEDIIDFTLHKDDENFSEYATQGKSGKDVLREHIRKGKLKLRFEKTDE